MSNYNFKPFIKPLFIINILVLVFNLNPYIFLTFQTLFNLLIEKLFGAHRFGVFLFQYYSDLHDYLFIEFGWLYLTANIIFLIPLLFYISYAKKESIPIKWYTVVFLYLYKFYFILHLLMNLFYGLIDWKNVQIFGD